LAFHDLGISINDILAYMEKTKNESNYTPFDIHEE